MRVRANVHPIVRDSRGGIQLTLQSILCQQLELPPRLHYEYPTISAAAVDFPVGENR